MKIKILIAAVIVGIILLSVDIYLTSRLFQSKQNQKIIERTLAIIKPDAVIAKNTGKIIDRIEKEGFEIKKLKKIHLTLQQAENFYFSHKNKDFYENITKFMSSSPAVIMVLEKEGAIEKWRNLIGNTNPEKSATNSLRKLYGTNIGRNAIHGSDSAQSAKHEIHFFFPHLN